MADLSNSKSNYFCEICEVSFPFASKYQRHLKSSGHQALKGVLSIQSSSAITEDSGSTQVHVPADPEGLKVFELVW